MAFPKVQTIATTIVDTNQTAHVQSMPASIAAGDLLLALFCVDVQPSSISWPGDWTELLELGDGSNICKVSVGYKKAAGGDTLTITTATPARHSSGVMYRIDSMIDPDTQAPEISTGVGGGSDDSPDPDSLTPTGGAKDFMWVAMQGHDHIDTTDSYPTNYSGNQTSTQGAVGASTGVGIATRELNASVEDPGVFTLSGNEQWVACTVAVHPLAAGGGATLTPTVGSALLAGISGRMDFGTTVKSAVKT